MASPPSPGVYPRVCGGTSSGPAGSGGRGGLSPRVRGNPYPARPPCIRQRSIPACAGNPYASIPTALRTGSIPACAGEPGNRYRGNGPEVGLSPRVRGNQTMRGQQLLSVRSIPACAGEPRVPDSDNVRIRVYPRVCGGTPALSPCSRSISGLSPRVRGNLAARARVHLRNRSIPACAGEPNALAGDSRRGQVYPRVCGGTCITSGAMP